MLQYFDMLAVGAELRLAAIEREAALLRQLTLQSRLAQQRQQVLIDALTKNRPLGLKLTQLAGPRRRNEASELGK